MTSKIVHITLAAMTLLSLNSTATAAVTATPDQFISTFAKIFGEHKGERKGHAKGVCFQGEFQGEPALAAYSDSPLFSGAVLPMTGRF